MTIGFSFGIGRKTFSKGLFIGVINQAQGAPFVDSCTTVLRREDNGEEMARYSGKCFLLNPFKRNSYGDRIGGKAIAIGTH